MAAALRAFSHRQPLFASALVIAVSACAVEWGGGFWPWGFLPVALGPIIAGWKLGTACAIAGMIATAGFQYRHDQRDELASTLSAIPSGTTFELKMTSDARAAGRSWTGSAKLVMAGSNATALIGHRIWVVGAGDAPPVAGSRLRVTGEFLPARSARNPGDFDEAAWLRREGMIGVFRIRRGPHESFTSRFAAWRAGVRNAFRTSITAGLNEDEQAAKVIRAVVLGEHPRDAAELVDAFRYSGTLHVFCVSGLHVGMVGFLGWAALGVAGVPRRWAVAIIIPMMFGYTWITGNGAPAVRASCMAAVFLTAYILQRRPNALNALGAVLTLMLLWDARILFRPGVQLSFGVVVAIIFGATLAANVFRWIGNKDAFLPQDEYGALRSFWLWLRMRVAQSLAVSTAAWIGSTPLTAYHFGIITPASIAATVVQIPVVFCLLASSLTSAMLHPWVPWASRAINQGNAGLSHLCVNVARAFAAIPGGSIRMELDRGSKLLVYDLPYGDGAAIFVPRNHAAVLIDCGSARTFPRQVAGSIRRQRLQAKSIILTYPGGGHTGGGAQVWESLPIRQALLPVAAARSPAYRSWLDDAPQAGVRTGFAQAGMCIRCCPEAWIEVLNEPLQTSPNARAEERVLILRMHWNGWRILFTSDAGSVIERKLLDAGVDCAADVIIAGKHPGDLPLGEAFLEAVSPRVIITSNPEFPSERRLDPTQAAYWRSIGIMVMDQKETGAVTLRVEPNGALRLDGFVDGSSITLAARKH